MADPLFALNVVTLTYDAYYFVSDSDINVNHSLKEFILSDANWIYDGALLGYKLVRVPLPLPPVPTGEFADYEADLGSIQDQQF